MGEIAKEIFSLIAPPIGWAVLGSLLTLFFTHRLSIGRDRLRAREADIRAERLQFLPLIEATMKEVAKEQPLLVWRKRKAELGASASRFHVLASGRRQRRFAEAWHDLEETKDEEMLYDGKEWFVPGHEAEITAARKLLAERLTRV